MALLIDVVTHSVTGVTNELSEIIEKLPKEKQQRIINIDADTQPIHVVADLCTGSSIMLADAAGKDDGIHAAHSCNVAADGLCSVARR